MSLLPRLSALHAPSRHHHHHPHRSNLTPLAALFTDTFNELQRLSDDFPAPSAFTPKFDVRETAEAYQLEGELPGIKQENMLIEFADERTLTITGRTEHVREQHDGEAEDGGSSKPTRAGPVPATDGASGDAGDTKAGTAEHPAGEGASGAVATKSTTVMTSNSGAEISAHAAPPQHTYWLSERCVGEFARSFSFPARVDREHVRASLKDGILRVVVPKLAQQSLNRRVTIEAE